MSKSILDYIFARQEPIKLSLERDKHSVVKLHTKEDDTGGHAEIGNLFWEVNNRVVRKDAVSGYATELGIPSTDMFVQNMQYAKWLHPMITETDGESLAWLDIISKMLLPAINLCLGTHQHFGAIKGSLTPTR